MMVMPHRKLSFSVTPLTSFVDFTLKLEVASSSETFLAVPKATRCRNPEDHNTNLFKAHYETVGLIKRRTHFIPTVSVRVRDGVTDSPYPRHGPDLH
jgi:hypothetical protein